MGAAASADGTPSPALQRRLERALVELHDDPDAVVIVTGGAVKSQAVEAHVMQRWLIARGVEPARIHVEDKARISIENAELVMPIAARVLHPHDATLTIVTERYHMKRSRTLFERALDHASLSRIDVREASAPDGLSGSALMQRAIRELGKLLRDVATQARMHAGEPLILD
jgi:vancomycin permeability regulator SanA